MAHSNITADTTLSLDIDPQEMLQMADRADWALLRMVACVAMATLALAAASGLAG